jgi:hypothetical protein
VFSGRSCVQNGRSFFSGKVHEEKQANAVTEVEAVHSVMCVCDG